MKIESFPFFTVRLLEILKLLDKFYTVSLAKFLYSARVSSNPNSLSTTIKILVAQMSMRRISIAKINSIILTFLNKRA